MPSHENVHLQALSPTAGGSSSFFCSVPWNVGPPGSTNRDARTVWSTFRFSDRGTVQGLASGVLPWDFKSVAPIAPRHGGLGTCMVGAAGNSGVIFDISGSNSFNGGGNQFAGVNFGATDHDSLVTQLEIPPANPNLS